MNPAPAVAAVPWESRARMGVVRAFVETVKLSFDPPKFYEAVAQSEDASHAVKFGIACWAIGGSVRATFGYLFGGILQIAFFGPQYRSMIGDFLWLGWSLVVAAALGFLAVQVFGGIVHAVLAGQEGATRSKDATLRVASYSGVAGLLSFVPGHLGNFVWIVLVLLNMVGLQKMHRCDQPKALISAVAAAFVVAMIYIFVFSIFAGVVAHAVIAAIS